MSWRPKQDAPKDYCPYCDKVVYHAERILGPDSKQWHRACMIKQQQSSQRAPGVFESDPLKQGKSLKPGVFLSSEQNNHYEDHSHQSTQENQDNKTKDPEYSSLSREEQRLLSITSRPKGWGSSNH
eukprot:TRINITY_DN3701_c0_g1_i1.p1 TRINITY_DN3701_c0_g1~~TRINITY_DN3701_c0_g1_i1.p1  ORF type:complete len:126 (+),score=22.60 TRINITY_DN3701_c0_g1_i1:90-467(+)